VPLLQGLFFHGVTLTGRGNYDEALQIFEEGLALSERVGDEVNRHRLLNSLGWLYIEIGDLDRAIDFNRKGAEGARKRGDPETIANPELNLADIFLIKGDLVLAQELLEGVYKLAKDPATSDWMRWRYSTHLFASLGELWLARGDYMKARKFCDHCLDIATRTQSKKNLVKGWRLRGEIALARYHWDEAENAFRQALAIAQAIGNPTQLWKSHLAFGRLYTDSKKPELAGEEFRSAQAVIDRMKGSLRTPGLRASLESAPMIQRIYDLSAR
jgi:tetratricopeptide (TPR) repeat protein